MINDKCLLMYVFCIREDADCNVCIFKEEQFQEEQSFDDLRLAEKYKECES